jgi:hypothetical protein
LARARREHSGRYTPCKKEVFLLNIKYLFNASKINKTLNNYPNLKHEITRYIEQAESSNAFPKLKKSGREIFRILSNQHYSHLVQLINIIEKSLKNGWDQPILYKTKNHIRFGSAVSELFVVNSLLNKGFNIKGFDAIKNSDFIPDIYAEKNYETFSIEVYCPRDWGPLNYFIDELRLSLLNLDFPINYKYSINIDTINDFNSEGALQNFNPWKFTEKFQSHKKRSKVIKNILSKIKNGQKNIDYEIDEINTLVKVSLDDIPNDNNLYPIRRTSSSFSLTGYAPDYMFEHLIKRRIRSKINKEQSEALPGEHINVLIIDISKLGYTHSFSNYYYLKKFGEIIKQNLSGELASFDLVAFDYNGKELKNSYPVPIIIKKSNISRKTINLLFGKNELLKPISDEILILHGV